MPPTNRPLEPERFEATSHKEFYEFDQRAAATVSAKDGVELDVFIERWGGEGVAVALSDDEAVALLACVRTVRPDLWQCVEDGWHDLDDLPHLDLLDDDFLDGEEAVASEPFEQLDHRGMIWRFAEIFVSVAEHADRHDMSEDEVLAQAQAIATGEAVQILFERYDDDVKDGLTMHLRGRCERWLLRVDVERE